MAEKKLYDKYKHIIVVLSKTDGTLVNPGGQEFYMVPCFAIIGTLETGTNKGPSIIAPCTLTIVKVKIYARTAPTGATLIVDVNKDGTTIFTTQGNRPTMAIGEHSADSGTPDVTTLAEGSRLDMDIDQIGSTVAGADLTVEVVCEQTTH